MKVNQNMATLIDQNVKIYATTRRDACYRAAEEALERVLAELIERRLITEEIAAVFAKYGTYHMEALERVLLNVESQDPGFLARQLAARSQLRANNALG